MIQTFLTGQPVAGLRALGVRGLPVTDYSEQIHAMLCLRGMHNIADCFAVPLRSQPSQDLQWYSPLQGEVIRWSEAEVQQKQQALLVLGQVFTTVEQLSEHCRAGKTPAGTFFARLLDKMASFPGEEAIYLVNNHPVITFWSYRHSDYHLSGRELTEHLLATLLPVAVDEPEPVQQPASLFLPAEDNSPGERTINPPLKPVWRVTALIIGALLVAGGGYFSGGMLRAAQQIPAKNPPSSAARISVTTSPVTLPDIRLPVQPSSLRQPVTPAPSPVLVTSSTPVQRLQLTASAVKMGNIRVMDGDWRAMLPNPTGNPLRLLFHFKQGRGEVRFDQPPHGHCKAESHSGFLPSGTLAIRSRFRASCQDGSRVLVPPVNCTLTTTGTLCTTAADAVSPGQTVILSASGGR